LSKHKKGCTLVETKRSNDNNTKKTQQPQL
jgi:hypothetical protein